MILVAKFMNLKICNILVVWRDSNPTQLAWVGF